MIVTGGFSSGGLERVTALIGNKLAKTNKVVYYSLEDVKPFYKLDATEIYDCPQNISDELSVFLFKSYRKIRQHLFKKNIVYLRRPSQHIDKYIKENNIDTVILTGWSLTFGDFLKNNNPNLNLILWMHSDHRTYFDNYFKDYNAELKNAMHSANHIIALTEEDVRGYSQYSERVIKISNPITIDNKGQKSDLNKKIISFTSRYVIDAKGLDYLVEIAKKLPDDWIINVAGSGNNAEVAAFKSMIMENNVEAKINLLGVLSDEKLRTHYQESSIYIMTSRWEGFGLVLTEAMSFGLPIISFKNSGSNEVLDDGKFGILVEQGSIEGFSQKLELLISNYDLRKEYSFKSLQRANYFEIESIIKKWENIV